MILLDTNVFVYAVGSEHPLKEPCRRLIDAQGSGLLDAATTFEVLQEFLHVRSRRHTREGAVAEARYYSGLLPVIPTRHDDFELGTMLYHTHPGLGSFDAILAAVAINRRVEALVSADKAFDGIRRLRWLEPSSAELARHR